MDLVLGTRSLFLANSCRTNQRAPFRASFPAQRNRPRQLLVSLRANSSEEVCTLRNLQDALRSQGCGRDQARRRCKPQLIDGFPRNSQTSTSGKSLVLKNDGL